MIFHYTNINSLISIMGIEDNNMDATPTFRAFDVRTFAKQEELRYDFNFLQPIMQELEREQGIPSLSCISRVQQRAMLTGHETEDFLDFNYDQNYVPYVLCFSSISNNDYLWNQQKEERVCIHVEESHLKKTENNFMCWGHNVMYGPNIQQIKSELKEWYKTYQNYFSPTNILNEINKNELITMSALRFCVYPFIKLDKKPYTLEMEYRVVCVVTNKELIKYTEGQRGYYELKLPKTSISRIDFSQSIPISKIQDIKENLLYSGYFASIEGRSIILQS